LSGSLKGTRRKEMNWLLFIDLIELEVSLVAFAAIGVWAVRFLRRGVWR
jgi:hypothetical protein